jgi:hypothetical protein
VEISKVCWEKLFDSLWPLVGVLVGGFITYRVTSVVATQRWQQEKADRRAQIEREGIAKALEWLDPMERALSRSNLLVSSLLQFKIDDERFLASYPTLVSDLAKLDVPMPHRILLSDNIYVAGNRIIRAFDEVRTEAIMRGQEASFQGKPMLGLHELGKKLDDIGRQIEELRLKLVDAYKHTFS